MEFKDINDEARQQMIETIREKLMKLGIHANAINFSTSTSYDGKEIIMVKTSEIQTIPTIYKSVHVEGNGSISGLPRERKQVFELAIFLSYRFQVFGGGENGVNIGAITFRFFSSDNGESYKLLGCLGLNI